MSTLYLGGMEWVLMIFHWWIWIGMAHFCEDMDRDRPQKDLKSTPPEPGYPKVTPDAIWGPSMVDMDRDGGQSGGYG